MSKERARRRAQRIAETRARVEAAARRERRRAAIRRLRPRFPRRRTGRLYVRRSRGQRAAIVAVGTLVVGLTWYHIDSLAARVAVTALVLLALPAFVIITLDRRI